MGIESLTKRRFTLLLNELQGDTHRPFSGIAFTVPLQSKKINKVCQNGIITILQVKSFFGWEFKLTSPISFFDR